MLTLGHTPLSVTFMAITAVIWSPTHFFSNPLFTCFLKPSFSLRLSMPQNYSSSYPANFMVGWLIFDDNCHEKLLWLVDLNVSVEALSINKYVRKWSHICELANNYLVMWSSIIIICWSDIVGLQVHLIWCLFWRRAWDCYVLVLLNSENHLMIGSTQAYYSDKTTFIFREPSCDLPDMSLIPVT